MRRGYPFRTGLQGFFFCFCAKWCFFGNFEVYSRNANAVVMTLSVSLTRKLLGQNVLFAAVASLIRRYCYSPVIVTCYI